MSDSVRPHRWQPTRLLRPWDSPGKDTGVCCHFLLQCMHACCRFSRVWFYVTLCTAAHQASLSTGFVRQEYWSGLPFPSPFIFPTPTQSPHFTVKKNLAFQPLVSCLCISKGSLVHCGKQKGQKPGFLLSPAQSRRDFEHLSFLIPSQSI